jgi:hypothetical protein
MTPVHRRQLIKDYENSQSGDITGHGIDITPKMRESILKGQSAFKRGGSVSPEQAELQRRMQSILRPDSDDPEMVQKYLQARASYDMPTHERGASSARVLPMAAHNVQTTIDALGNAVPKQAQNMSWNAFHKLGKGGTLFTLGGDRSNLGRLTHINGKEMAWPVDLHAGTKYMAEPNPGAVWANAKGARTALRTNILEAAKKGPVYGAFAAMGPTAVDSANNMFDVLMAQVPGSGISKKDAEAFDNSLKRGDHIKGSAESDIKKREAAKKVMENWPGIQNAEKARDFAKTISGGHRGAIVKYMEAAPWQKAGFPSVGITRAAITDPELLDVSGNMMGHHVVELDPQTYNKANLAFHHSTYDYPTGGKLVGKLPFIERHVATPDFTEQQVMDKAVVKKTGEPLIIHPYSPNDQGRSSYRGNTEMRQAVQPINDRMLESIQEKHGTSFADGGEVDKFNMPAIDRAVSVYPKPQRMFPDDARPAGGQYLNARTKEDMTGHKASIASIGVNPGGRPYFNASPDSVDQTGSPGRGSAMAKTNLFKQKAGWKWLQTPEGHEDTNTIVSVEHRGNHHYALNAHFPKGVELARYSEAKNEPRLRPTTQGNLTKGTQVGSISVRGKEHPVYDHVIVKSGGGSIVDRALMLTSKKA